MSVTKGLAWIGFLVLADDKFYAEVGRSTQLWLVPIMFLGQVRDEYQRTLGTPSTR